MKLKMLLSATALAVMPAFAQDNLKSGIERENMDVSIRPGNDFFEYAAGGWMKSHPLTPEFSRYAQFNVLQENTQEQVRDLILGLAAANYPDGSLGQKIGALYRLGMDSARLNREGCEPIRSMLQAVEEVDSREAYFQLAARLSRVGVSSFFNIGCDADLRNSKENLVQVAQGGIAMRDRGYYIEDDEASTKIREAYRRYVRRLFTLTGKEETEASRMMEAVLRIETRIATASYSATKRRDIEANYHRMSFADLCKDYAGIDWDTLFRIVGIPPVEAVSVNQPEPIHEVEKILHDTPLEDLKAYLYFNVADNSANCLSDEFRSAAFDFYNRAMSGAEQDRPRWKRTVSAIEGVMGMAVGRMYVEKYFPESSKQRMQELVRNLQTALGQRIDAQTWMSEATKRQAHEKLASFYVKIGYPDTWMSYDSLLIDESRSYLENMNRASEYLSQYYLRKHVNQPVDKDEWLMTPQTINAYYNPTTNEICFPAGILQPPFFHAEADDACNYGAIGVVIGHEMTHGFDDQGSRFDKEGNLKNWWTEEDARKFAKRTQQMADYFGKIEALPDCRINGKLTNGENIADHGGLNIALQALRNAMTVKPLADKDGFTPEQRFFLSYGLIWGNNIRPEALRKQCKTDPHSPGRWRVNGALPHIDAWYDAFGITKKDAMYLPKKQRVDIW